MTDRFNRLIKIILLNEGGFVNDPNDQGGATKYGVSMRFLKSVGDLDFDLDGDGDIDIDDVRRLTLDKAGEVYKEYFYDPLKIDQINDERLALQVFDHAVNAGKRSAASILQRIADCRIDGIIGPKTVAAVNTFHDNIAFRYMQGRYLHYDELVDKNPRLVKYIGGWNNRVKHTYECQL